MLCEGGREQREHLAARADELRPELNDLLRPRRDRVPRRCSDGDATQRCISLCDRAAVVRRQLRARRRRAAESTVEVRPSRGRCALDDAETVRGEDERRQLGAQLLGAAQRCSVDGCVLRRAGLELHLHVDGSVASVAVRCDARPVCPEADQLPVVARAR